MNENKAQKNQNTSFSEVEPILFISSFVETPNTSTRTNSVLDSSSQKATRGTRGRPRGKRGMKDLIQNDVSSKSNNTIESDTKKLSSTIKNQTFDDNDDGPVHFCCQLPEIASGISEDGTSWKFRCFCDKMNESDFMVECEKCGCWQHAACININSHTLADHYICPICSMICIRCSCGSNLNYQYPIIKCSKCGYYSHRRCEGLADGPYNTEGHICSHCGGTPNPPNDISFSQSPQHGISNNEFIMSQNQFAYLHNYFKGSIFDSILLYYLAENPNDISFDHILPTDFPGSIKLKPSVKIELYDFCQFVYNHCRSFFFLTHPLLESDIPKKRRAEISYSFFHGLFSILKAFFHLSENVFITLFDELATNDLYYPTLDHDVSSQNSSPIIPQSNINLDFSERAKNELMKLRHIQEIPSPSKAHIAFSSNPNGVKLTIPIQGDTIVLSISGYVGLSGEFTYGNKINPSQFAISDSNLIVDTSVAAEATEDEQILNNLMSSFRRSFSPNCMLKLYKNGTKTSLGLFAGIADICGIKKRNRREKFLLPAGSELTLPYDFIYATLEQPLNEFLSWRFDDQEINLGYINSAFSLNNQMENSSISNSDLSNTLNTNKKKEKSDKKSKTQKEKKEKKNEKKDKFKNTFVDSLLFGTIKESYPESFLFSIYSDETKQIDQEKENEGIEPDFSFCYHDNETAFHFQPLKIENPLPLVRKILNPYQHQ